MSFETVNVGVMMTKQEKIREGLVNICRERTSGAGKMLTNEILDYLHSQGVVIKIESFNELEYRYKEKSLYECVKVGFEPLIEVDIRGIGV